MSESLLPLLFNRDEINTHNQPLKRQGSPPYHLLARLETTEIRIQNTLHKPIKIRHKYIRNMRKRRIIQASQLLPVPVHSHLQSDVFTDTLGFGTIAKVKTQDRLSCKDSRPTSQIDFKLGLQNQNTMFFP
jgi:hypothetical protein